MFCKMLQFIYLNICFAHYGNSSKWYISILQDKPHFLVLHNFTKCLFDTRANQTESKHLNGLNCLIFSICYFWLRKKWCLQNFFLIKKWMMLEIVNKSAFEAIKLPYNLLLVCRFQGRNLVFCSLYMIDEICVFC